MKNPSEIIENAKKKAAYTAIDEFVREGMIIGIGSGSTIIYAVERLISRVKNEGLKITCIPTSFQSYQLITSNKLNLGNLDLYPDIDIDIDGADEIDNNLNLIKGGGGCHVHEKIIANNSKQMVVIADYRKESINLGEKWRNGIPIEVIPIAYVPIMKKLEKMGGKPILRMGKNKAGPCISDNGNFIIDVDFGVINNPIELNEKIKSIPGVIDTGIFINNKDANIVAAYIGLENGNVKKVLKKNN